MDYIGNILRLTPPPGGIIQVVMPDGNTVFESNGRGSMFYGLSFRANTLMTFEKDQPKAFQIEGAVWQGDFVEPVPGDPTLCRIKRAGMYGINIRCYLPVAGSVMMMDHYGADGVRVSGFESPPGRKSTDRKCTTSSMMEFAVGATLQFLMECPAKVATPTNVQPSVKVVYLGGS